ncbi:low molecular weight phosphotyrosine protein phosphatase 1-like [Phlebotomus papatasi]|uniref:low molecular weight phosphotyrosine protein phosphatase 1-like n=1 Tax=Phlebotomus papatasi TaxID=29031 RepID=UPI002483971F|nr:low molecular weight phosphotyrosine protein phosphatase 1-like [Phlebotomus papatasi]
MDGTTKSALFVCLGNTCRSPIAEAVFMDEVKKAGQEDKWNIDSAAIANWHVGKNPNRRSIETMAKHNLPFRHHKARQIKKEDFNKFDYIFGMDRWNISDLKERAPANSSANILLLGDFDPEGQRNIRDPYCDTGLEGFEECYVQCVRSCKAFLAQTTEGRI